MTGIQVYEGDGVKPSATLGTPAVQPCWRYTCGIEWESGLFGQDGHKDGMSHMQAFVWLTNNRLSTDQAMRMLDLARKKSDGMLRRFLNRRVWTRMDDHRIWCVASRSS